MVPKLYQTQEEPEYQCISGTCLAHSGMSTRMNIVIGLLSALLSLFAYSSFVQVPQMEKRTAERVSLLERKLFDLDRDVKEIKTENQRLISQRNADHPTKDPFR